MHQSGRSRPRPSARAIVRITALAVAFAPAAIIGTRRAQAAAPTFVARSLDGSGNNSAHSAWGKAGANYVRVAAANYADGKSAMVAGPNARYISDRIFNDT